MLKATAERLRAYYQRRQIAYAQVFKTPSPYVDEVMKDLAKFCRAHESTFHKDPQISAVLEGRREVFLRIQENLKLNLEDIYRLHFANEREE
jgi:hypothetical protein